MMTEELCLVLSDIRDELKTKNKILQEIKEELIRIRGNM